MVRVDTRQRIVEAATEIFVEKGMSGAGLADICLRAGVTEMTIRRAFPDRAQAGREMDLKRRLVSEVYRAAGAAFTEGLRRTYAERRLDPEQSSPVELVLVYCDLVFELLQGDDLLAKQTGLLFGVDGAPQTLTQWAFEGDAVSDLAILDAILLRSSGRSPTRAAAVRCLVIGTLQEYGYARGFPPGSTYVPQYDREEILSVLETCLVELLGPRSVARRRAPELLVRRSLESAKELIAQSEKALDSAIAALGLRSS